MNSKGQLTPRSSAHLDLIRGVSAFAVMAGHVRGLFFLDYANLGRHSLFTGALYEVTGFGHEAVIVFFVLSGYFIGGSVFQSVEDRRWSWQNYLVNRLTRLQLVLLPALLLGFLWDQIGMRVPQAASFYFGGLYKYYPPSVAARSTAPVFFGNLFFLQSIVSPVFGSNGPLWSLSYEFWYYILFPALMLAVVSWLGMGARTLYLALFAGLIWFVGYPINLYFLIWLMGALVGRLPHLNWPTSARATGLLSAFAALPFVAILAWVRVHPSVPAVAADFSIGVFFSLWIYVLIQSRREDVLQPYVKATKTLAGFSYTLYLLHFPALLLLRGLLDPRGDWQPDALHLMAALAITVLILAYAYFVAECTEARTTAVRRRILQPWLTRTKEVA